MIAYSMYQFCTVHTVWRKTYDQIKKVQFDTEYILEVLVKQDISMF